MPKAKLMTREHDEDERFTFTKLELTKPSTELEEELSATILRIAKDQFQKRKRRRVQPSIEDVAATPGGSGSEASAPSSRAASVRPDTGDEGERMQIDEVVSTPTRRTRRTGNETYEPMVSTNDDLSYGLLNPPTRHILSQLDATLSILRNSRVAGLSYLSDSSTEEESDSQTLGKNSRRRRRAKADSGVDTDAQETDALPKSTKRGRPRKVHIPRDGETLQEMQLRIARTSHRRLPHDKEAAFEEWLRRGEVEAERQRSISQKGDGSEGLETEGDEDGERSVGGKKIARWGLRDWSDVLGAAALAGFSGDVIARATRRCANLFGEGMVMTRLNEVPVSQGTGIQSTEYRPEPIQLNDSDLDAEDESDEGLSLAQRRVASRQASLARSSRDLSSDDSRGRVPSRSRTGTPAPAHSRSGSCSSPGLVFCPISSCNRAAKGFTRKANLKRHMELVHQGQTEDLDSDDEVAGAVHVDGFLKKIVPSRGWRGEDTMMRKRKRHWGDVEVGGGASRSRAATEERGDSSS